MSPISRGFTGGRRPADPARVPPGQCLTNDCNAWESLGYHNRGDPWLEQRYQGD